MDDAVLDVVPKFRSNPLSDFENGVGLDLRVKLAAELLKAPIFAVSIGPAEDARRALDTARSRNRCAGTSSATCARRCSSRPWPSA